MKVLIDQDYRGIVGIGLSEKWSGGDEERRGRRG